jgi:hypothetical protein
MDMLGSPSGSLAGCFGATYLRSGLGVRGRSGRGSATLDSLLSWTVITFDSSESVKGLDVVVNKAVVVPNKARGDETRQ